MPRHQPSRTLRAAWAAVGAALLAACASGGPQPHIGLGELWGQYERLRPVKALAVAGDLDRVWVAGAAGGADSWQEAQDSAMAKCEERRHVRRVTDRCRIYARGSQIVWTGP